MDKGINHNVLIARMGVGVARTLAKKGFNKHFDRHNGNALAAKLYGKIGSLCDEIDTCCDSMETCVKLIQEETHGTKDDKPPWEG